MATDITSRVVISPAITGTLQSSFMNGGIVINPVIPGVLHSSAMTGSITVSIVNTQPAEWPYLGVESIWEINIEQFRYDSGINITLPMLMFKGTGVLDPLGQLNISIPALTLNFSGVDDPLGQLRLSIPRLSFAVKGVVDPLGILSVTIPPLRLTATVITGTIGTLSLTIPSFRFKASSNISTEGILSVTIPMIRTIFTALGISYHNMVLNLYNNALTEFANYPFNSFCRFDDKNLGATATGIYDLDSGETDNGDQIEWNFRTAYVDLDQKVAKRLRQAWFSYKSTGDLVVTVVQPDGTEYEYELTSYEVTEDGVRVKFGKGIKSKYVALDIRNVDGSSITLDVFKLHLEKLGGLR